MVTSVWFTRMQDTQAACCCVYWPRHDSMVLSALVDLETRQELKHFSSRPLRAPVKSMDKEKRVLPVFGHRLIQACEFVVDFGDVLGA